MFDNLNLRTKLVAIIAAPLLVLVGLALLGSQQRGDAAASARVDGNVVAAVRADTAVAEALEVESAQLDTSKLDTVATGPSSAAVRAKVDANIHDLSTALGRLDGGDLSRSTTAAVTAMDNRLAGVASLRIAVDDGALPWLGAIDAYGETVSAVLSVAQELAADASRPEVRRSLATIVALARVSADVAANGNLLTGVLSVGGWPDAATETRFQTGATTEDLDIASFEAAASPEVKVSFANASTTAAASLLDAVRQSARSGDLKAALSQRSDWASAFATKTSALRSIEQGLSQSLEKQNLTWVAAAERTARLYLLLAAAAVLLALLIAGLVARSLTRRMRTLTDAADHLSEHELPRMVAALEHPDDDELARLTANLDPIDVRGRDELGRLAGSFNHLQRVTVDVATEQAALLQRGIADTFVNLARRNQALLDRQIEQLDRLEMTETDPDQLANLFSLDHLATRMRRNAESLLVLAGAAPTRRRGKPVPLTTVIQAAIGEVEAFSRIDLLNVDHVEIELGASVDVTHLLAELMDNAASFSPPSSRVEVAGRRSSAGGYVLTVTDHGVGMDVDQLQHANELLAAPPVMGLSLGRTLGLLVVGRLATRFDIGVRLLTSATSGGCTAVITLPPPLLLEAGEPAGIRTHEATESDPSLDDPGRAGADEELAEGMAAGVSDLQRRFALEDLVETVEAERPSSAELPLLPILDASAHLRFGELPSRSGGNKTQEPLVARRGERHATAITAGGSSNGESATFGEWEPAGEGADPTPDVFADRLPVAARAPLRFGDRADAGRHGERNGGQTRRSTPVGAPAVTPNVTPSAPSTSGGAGEAAPVNFTQPPVSLAARDATTGLARRVPRSGRGPLAGAMTGSGSQGDRIVALSARSAARRRAALTSYRSGLRNGREGDGTGGRESSGSRDSTGGNDSSDDRPEVEP